MARFASFDLNADQTRRAEWVRRNLANALHDGALPVTIDFVKHDGSERCIRGKAVRFVGSGSNEAVVIETEKGFRSANLWAIKGIHNMNAR